MPDYDIGQGIQALDFQAFVEHNRGYAVADGCAVTAGTGLSVDVAGGNAVFGRSGGSPDVVAVAGGNVSLSTADATNPRKDTIYVAPDGSVNAATGSPAPYLPTGATGVDAHQPSPPTLSGTDAVILAEVVVPAGATDTVAGNIYDRRQFSETVTQEAIHESVNTRQINNVEVIEAGDNLQSILNNATDNTVYYIESGDYTTGTIGLPTGLTNVQIICENGVTITPDGVLFAVQTLNTNNLTWVGGKIDGSQGNGGNMWDASGDENLTVRDMNVTAWNGGGLFDLDGGVDGVVIDGITATNLTDCGACNVRHGKNISISNSLFRDPNQQGDDGISIKAGAGDSRNITVSNVTIDGHQVFISVGVEIATGNVAANVNVDSSTARRCFTPVWFKGDQGGVARNMDINLTAIDQTGERMTYLVRKTNSNPIQNVSVDVTASGRLASQESVVRIGGELNRSEITVNWRTLPSGNGGNAPLTYVDLMGDSACADLTISGKFTGAEATAGNGFRVLNGAAVSDLNLEDIILKDVGGSNLIKDDDGSTTARVHGGRGGSTTATGLSGTWTFDDFLGITDT